MTGGLFKIESSRVVITGAGGGVGVALCRAFAEAGASVIGCDVDGAVFPDTCAQTHRFDLLDTKAVVGAAGEILKSGPPDIVVSNAGWTRAETMAQVTQSTLVNEMDRNFTGAAVFANAFLPAMRKGTGNRSFVFVASVNALSHFGNPVYAAAKSALLAWMRALATEEGCHGIRANAVVPGSIRTNAWTHRLKAEPDLLDRMSRLYPLGRIVTPEEVSNAILFLASPLSSGITGTALNVDAGLTAGNLPFLDAIS